MAIDMNIPRDKRWFGVAVVSLLLLAAGGVLAQRAAAGPLAACAAFLLVLGGGALTLVATRQPWFRARSADRDSQLSVHLDDSPSTNVAWSNDPNFLLGGLVATQQLAAGTAPSRVRQQLTATARSAIEREAQERREAFSSRRRCERSVPHVLVLAEMQAQSGKPPRAMVLDVSDDGSGVALRLSSGSGAFIHPTTQVEFAIQNAHFIGRVTRVDQQQSWRRVGVELGDVKQRLELLRVLNMAHA